MSERPKETAAVSSENLRTVTPDLPKAILRDIGAYIQIKKDNLGADKLAGALRGFAKNWEKNESAWSLERRAVALVLADLLDQGWDVTVNDRAIHLQPPGLRLVGESAENAKERLRRALQTSRDRQLGESGVRRFVDRMHRTVPRAVGRSSIADVVDDGAELAAQLERAVYMAPRQAAAFLKTVIDPVIEVCDEDAKCAVTGLRLIDIWRYFRHTWSLEYRPIPGRQLNLLIRNAARPKRPVVGIAMLASPVVRMRVRDDWIGWNPEPFLAKLKTGEWDCEVALRSLVSRLQRNIDEIRCDDLVTPDEIAFPAERTILRLEQKFAGAAFARQRQLELLYTQAEEANEAIRSQREGVKVATANTDWRTASEDNLFIRKRAETLAELLDAKRTFQALNWNTGGPELLRQLLAHPNGLRTVNAALVEVRKVGLSSQVADVSVCGAVAPYSALLGGKLVALLMTSQEVRDAYRSRYADQVSLISSQMAGRAIFRPAELKFLTTTSLYGNGSSQYNRLRLRREDFPQLDHDIAWQELAQTTGFGTVHFQASTVKVLREYSQRSYGARRINNRFGEGASPRLRQIREAMDALGINASSVLHHATPRIFYGCELHPGAREELLGFSPTTESKGHSAGVIAGLWRDRWLTGRIRNPQVMARVEASSASTIAGFFSRVQASASAAGEDLSDEVAL